MTKWLKVAIFCHMVALAGCGSVISDTSLMQSNRKSVQQAVPSGLRFGDHKPHDFGRKNPANYAIHGIDVSKYQNHINWQEIKRAGIEFAFVKATEGGDRVDERFKENWQGAQAAGIARGAYHFYYFCRSAQEQAVWFIANVPKQADSLPPVLDMEWNHQSPTCKVRPTPQVVRQEMRIFLELVERHYGKRAIIYTTLDFFDKNGLAEFKDQAFWLRSVAAHPDEKYGAHPWLFWQYTGTGIVPGIREATDINVFAGSAQAWIKWQARN